MSKIYKKGHIELTKKIYLEPLKSVLGHSIIHYCQYLDKYLNSLLCGFRKAHSSQHALFKLLQAWQEELDKSGFVETILMDI